MAISNAQARFSFFLAYVVYFAANCALIALAWKRYFVTTDAMVELLKQLASVYAAPLGIVIAGLFADRRPGDADVMTLCAGLTLVLFWNALVSWPFGYLVLVAGPQQMGIGWVPDYWRSAADVAGFMSTAALTFFFLKKDN